MCPSTVTRIRAILLYQYTASLIVPVIIGHPSTSQFLFVARKFIVATGFVLSIKKGPYSALVLLRTRSYVLTQIFCVEYDSKLNVRLFCATQVFMFVVNALSASIVQSVPVDTIL